MLANDSKMEDIDLLDFACLFPDKNYVYTQLQDYIKNRDFKEQKFLNINSEIISAIYMLNVCQNDQVSYNRMAIHLNQKINTAMATLKEYAKSIEVSGEDLIRDEPIDIVKARVSQETQETLKKGFYKLRNSVFVVQCFLGDTTLAEI